MENISKKIKETIKSIIEDSTIHGIPRVVKSNSWISKITWIIFSTVSTGMCLFAIISSILNYFEYKVITSIETLTEIPAAFPVITICSLNQLQKPNNYSLLDLVQKIPNLNNVQKNFQLMSILSSYNESFKKSISYSLNESLISCTINTIDCSASEFVWSFVPFYGNCYSFNTGIDNSGSSVDLIKISKAGNLNGLRLELFIGNLINIPELLQTYGYHVIIHNQTAAITFNEGYEISTGTETNLAVNRLHETKKPVPYSDCIDLNSIYSYDSYLYKVMYVSNQTYRQTECFNLCFQLMLIETCKCFVNTFNRLNGSFQCLTDSQVTCSLNTWRSFISDNYINKNCIQQCPTECNSISYKITSSFSNYPSYNYGLKTLMKNPMISTKFPNESLTYDFLKQCVLSLNIYYDQLSYTQISKDAKLELVDLISNIGGLLGLFLGMSFLTFIEFIEMIIETFVIIFSKRSNVRRISIK